MFELFKKINSRRPATSPSRSSEKAAQAPASGPKAAPAMERADGASRTPDRTSAPGSANAPAPEQIAPQFDAGLIQSVMNDTFPGLTMYVRDVDLPKELEERYVPGEFLRELGFTDASARVMGMVTTHRFAILSNHMGDLSAFEHGTNWGLHVANKGSRFKVLDICRYQGKTQILLLHLPDDHRWKLFEKATFSLEEDLIKSCRQRFENKCCLPPVPELATPEWKARCADPIGMDAAGVRFSLD